MDGGETARAGDGPVRMNNLGTLRLVAALFVLVGHSYATSHPGIGDPISEAISGVMPLDRGLPGQGVAIFFVISGYLVTQSYLRRGSLARFGEARLLRIFPALWCAVALTILACSIESTIPPGQFLQSQTVVDYAVQTSTLTNTHAGLPGVFVENPTSVVNMSLWTLPIELGLYALVAVAGVVGLLRGRALFNVAALAVIAAFIAGGKDLPLVSGAHPSELVLFFVAGSALFVNRDLLPLRGWAAGVAALAAVALPTAGAVGSVLVVAAMAYFVMWIGLTPRMRLPDLSARGDASYGTYLYAAPVTQMWIAGVGPSSPGLIMGLTAAIAVPLGFLSWHTIELPALRLKGRFVDAAGRLLRRGERRKPAEATTRG